MSSVNDTPSPLLVVGSVALDSVETATDAAARTCWAERRRSSPWPPPSWRRCASPGWWAPTSPRSTSAFLGRHGSIWRASSASPGGPSAGRALLAGLHVRARPSTPSSTSSRLPAQAAGRRGATAPYVFLANIDPELQLDVLAQVDRPALRRLRHDELLDRGQARGAAAPAGAGRYAAAQRRGGAAAARAGTQPAGGGARHPRHGPQGGGRQAGRRGGAAVPRGRGVRRAGLPHRGRWSIPPAPATPSRAASWAGWRAPAPPPPPTSAPP